MTDLFVYDLNDNLIGCHNIDFEILSGENLTQAKNRSRDFLNKKFGIKTFDKDTKVTIHRNFGEEKFSIILKISDKQLTREMILTNILNK